MKNLHFYLVAFLLLLMSNCKQYNNDEYAIEAPCEVVCTDSVSEEAPLYDDENQVAENTESYASLEENAFESPKTNPLSTFSIDVDNASYTNIRRFINNGQDVHFRVADKNI